MCVSFGVMLPVGNPPNAIVFSYGHVQISDMVRHKHISTNPHWDGTAQCQAESKAVVAITRNSARFYVTLLLYKIITDLFNSHNTF